MAKDKRIDQLTPSSIALSGDDLFAIHNTNGTRNETLSSITTFITANVPYQYNSGSTTSIEPRLGTNVSSGPYSAILGGRSHTIVNSYDSAILGGNGNRISPTAFRSVILGGSNITGDTSDTVFVPNLESKGNVSTGGLHVGTSISTGDTTSINITMDDYYIRSTSISGDTKYKLPSSNGLHPTPKDGQIVVLHKHGDSVYGLIATTGVGGGITKANDIITYDEIKIQGTNNSVTLLYDADLDSWITIATVGAVVDIQYITTI